MSMDSPFYSSEELSGLGLKSCGRDVLISRLVRFYGVNRISIGDNVRIDDYCIICGDVSIGSNIHIAPYCVLYGQYGIRLEDYSGLSARVSVYSGIDDFSGEYAIGPMLDFSIRRLDKGQVTLGQYVQVGVGSTIFPNVTIEEGAVVGAMSLVKTSLKSWGVYAGIPVKRLKDRKKDLIARIKSVKFSSLK